MGQAQKQTHTVDWERDRERESVWKSNSNRNHPFWIVIFIYFDNPNLQKCCLGFCFIEKLSNILQTSRYSIWRQLGHHTMNFTEWRFDEQTRPIPAVSPIQNCTQAMSWWNSCNPAASWQPGYKKGVSPETRYWYTPRIGVSTATTRIGVSTGQ